ncbi:MAG: hypothetical protein L7G97_07035 [Acidilobus sp.]|nr:hypothetical protein [Acidilobus sp.]
MSSDNKGTQAVVMFPIVRITRDDIKELIEDIRRSVKIRLPQMAEEGSELIEDAIELVIRAVMAQNNMLEIIVPMQQIMGTIWMLLSRVMQALTAVVENASNSVVTAVALKKEGEDAAKIFEDADRTVKVATLALGIAPLVVVRLVAINLPPQLRPSLAVESAGIMMPVVEQPKKGRGWL